MQNQKPNYTVEHKTMYTGQPPIHHEHVGYNQSGIKTSLVGMT
jgi:hypothetical protein